MKNTGKDYWESRWQRAQTGWDLGEISPPLKDYIDSLVDKNQRILIPGCGNAYEAAYLLGNGFSNITVIDIVPALTQELAEKLSKYVSAGTLHIICGDFFEHTGRYDLILEQTFFCAILPELRPAYAKQMYTLLNPGGKLVGLLFNRPFEGGPPFGGDLQEYRQYFEPLFNPVKMDPCYNSAKPRAGSELFIQLCKTI
jgi:SAM-dependent methyltransferase